MAFVRSSSPSAHQDQVRSGSSLLLRHPPPHSSHQPASSSFTTTTYCSVHRRQRRSGRPLLLYQQGRVGAVIPAAVHHHHPALLNNNIHNMWRLSAHAAAGSSQLTAMAAVAVNRTFMSSVSHFVELLLVFILGGLFFSTAMAAVTAVTAIGKENMLQIWSIVKLILSRVWNVFKTGLGEARQALRLDGKWKWRDGWRVLKASLLETRKIAAEGVQSLRAEANLYFAAVGAPGLLPLQYVVDRLMPYSIATQLEEGFQDALSNVQNPNIRKLTLTEFTAGNKAPELLSARMYELGNNAMGFDIDTEWTSELVAKIKLQPKLRFGIPVPVTIQKVSFRGIVRCGLVPLMHEPPGFGAALISFPAVPQVGLDVRVAGSEITKVPWLRSELMKEIRKSIEEQLLWPKRTVVAMKDARGRVLLSPQELKELETVDPLLVAEEKLALEKPMLKEYLEKTKPDKKGLSKLLNIVVGDGSSGGGDDT